MPGHGSRKDEFSSNPVHGPARWDRDFVKRNIGQSGLSRCHINDKTSYTPPKIWEWDKRVAGVSLP